MKLRIQSFLMFLLVPLTMAWGEDYKQITLEDIFREGTFKTTSIYGLRSMNDGEHYTTSDSGKYVIKFRYKTGNAVDTVFNLDKIGTPPFTGFSAYAFSPEEHFILFTTGRERIYRRSYIADFYIYEIATGKLTKLSENGKLTLPDFSPDEKFIAFVRNNNLFLFNMKTKHEKQLTDDGKFNHIINGTTDWVYEEEFSLTKGFYWSPDSRRLAYYRFDESRVKLFNMTRYDRKLYPENYAFKYPKAGEENSIVEIFVYDLASGRKSKMDTGEEDDQYIPAIQWTKNKLAVIRMNRLQNRVDILLADPVSGETSVLYTENNKKYIEELAGNYLTFLDNGKHFVINSEMDGFNHLYLFDMTGRMVKQLTSGQWDVDRLVGIDQKKGKVYYTSSEESPLQRALYVVGLDGKNKRKLSAKSGTNRAVFSATYKYYINYFSSATQPLLVTLHTSGGKGIRVLAENSDVLEKAGKTGVGSKEFFQFTTTEGVTLNGYMIKPPGFDPHKKYPVFMYVYGGPGSQTVLDRWSFGWNELIAQRGYIVVSVDNRGTGARGEAFKKITYGELGKYETADQIEAARYLGNLPFVDASRIGIFGWSYGGFMAASCLFKGHDVFKMGIAVAPVTSWRFYDTIYTERYMGLPQDNAEGYDDNSPINFADMLEGKFLLIHGTADDNVHFQNSIELINALIEAEKAFDMKIYPDKAHGISGRNYHFHVYKSMTDFIMENL
ncbi:MAG: S9 family peptidase [Chlorobi bacterium]|nr:S9 family peptidase [Chlorobiota bacterium]